MLLTEFPNANESRAMSKFFNQDDGKHELEMIESSIIYAIMSGDISCKTDPLTVTSKILLQGLGYKVVPCNSGSNCIISWAENDENSDED